ncbi:coiled-coil domain-containing protein 30 [Pseudomonas sp. MAG002Y]|uniref:coiled-coil domain-containing protein 30 n=1 Tax=Pseudomonas sp. MAG002Y TaxID=2678690 RepID=UPI001C60A137|nr:coiled-coil domain-containing protein 30 [Pseudomonas sp. MAG002Y]MBW5416391.1 hypothetical protein [Pseudomonas sp. MAG002Y]
MENDDIEFDSELYYRYKAERMQRMRIALAVIPAMVGLAAILFASLISDFMDFPFPISRPFLSLVGLASLLVSGMAILMIYLQTGFKRQPAQNFDHLRYEDELRRLRNRLEHSASISTSELKEMQSELKYLRQRADQDSRINELITENEKDELVSRIKESIERESSKEIYQETLSKIQDKLANHNRLKEVESVFMATLERLRDETSALGRRGNLNLGLGILTTIIGLGILGYFVIEIDAIPEDKTAFVAYFIPRLSLVLLIEVFAYFFLKLYKASLQEIKYFQNEMTNSEAKLVALKCSIMTSDAPATSEVIRALACTERNGVLEKGQTTADIEKNRIEQQNISVIADKVSSLLGSRK